MRTFLPPEEPRRDAGPIRGIPGAGPVAGRDAAHAAPAPDDGRLVRTSSMTAAAARSHLATWQGEAPSHPIPAPPGVTARERRRPDRVRPGAVRLQRLAVAVRGDEAAVAHWSVVEPATPADERAWQRALGRVASPPERGGWTA